MDFAKSQCKMAIAKKFHSSSDLHIDSAHVGTTCTILETKDAWVQGKTQQVALVEFADGVRRIWPVDALEVK